MKNFSFASFWIKSSNYPSYQPPSRTVLRRCSHCGSRSARPALNNNSSSNNSHAPNAPGGRRTCRWVRPRLRDPRGHGCRARPRRRPPVPRAPRHPRPFCRSISTTSRTCTTCTITITPIRVAAGSRLRYRCSWPSRMRTSNSAPLPFDHHLQRVLPSWF